MSERYSQSDIDLVGKCLDSYFQNMPATYRIGYPIPMVDKGRASHFLVPPDMVDGQTSDPQTVIWKHRFDSRKRIFALAIPCGGIPPLLRAYLHHWRVCYCCLSWQHWQILLPPTPTHRFNFGFYRYFLQWAELSNRTNFVVFAETQDRQHLICADREAVDTEGDSPIVAIPIINLVAMGMNFQRELVESVVIPVASSFREILVSCCLHNSTISHQHRPSVRLPVGKIVIFNWDHWLSNAPEIGMDKSHAVHEVHWKRILKKVLQLRAADPVCLLPGSEYHQYQMNPPCSKEQMQRFEERENCIVPEIMALFMMNVGDGGIGPHRWLYPLETSTPDAFAGTDQWEVLDDDHFLTSFPHIQHWNQEVPAGDEDAFQNYMHPREIRSTLLVTHFFENSSHRTLLMPTKGPERGNLWVDDRTDRRGIYPFLRKGPWSFVSWFEQSLDKMLFRIDQQYEDISRRSFSEYLQFRDEAWAINHAE